MLNIEAIARSLTDEKATVTTVAHSLGRLTERRTAYFTVDVEDSHVESAQIGVAAGGTVDNAPEYVVLDFRDNDPISLEAAPPFCKEWKVKPTNPGASPWFYACSFAGSSASIKVVLFASLTGERGTPAARLSRLTLQRNDWR